MAKHSQRSGTTRIRMTALLCVATLACVACGGPASATPPAASAPALEAASPVLSPASSALPAPADTPIAAPSAANQSPEDLVRDAFLKKWLALFPARPIEFRAAGVYDYAKITIQNMADWEHNLAILKAGGPSDSPLMVNYTLAEVNTAVGFAWRINGQLQLTNMHLVVGTGAISDFQKNTGVEFIGGVDIDASVAYRTNLVRGGSLSGGNLGQRQWAATENSAPLPSAFSDSTAQLMFDDSYTVKNGRITKDETNIRPALGNLFLPTEAMLPEKQDCEHGYDVAPCQWLP